jgi:hypothetical protein
MIYIQYTAKPKLEPINPSDDAGAYINCWINYSDMELAKNVAEKMIDESGWIISSMDNVEFITREFYTNDADDSHSKYFDQAEIDNEVIAIFSYPLVDEEE